MADEQIKIRIQADAEQFKTVSAAVEKALADIGKQADITQGKIKSAGNAVKQSNQAWTNLALVIQDLPYGFRGIQNNLPALVGGIAGATGAIYLAFSTVIAITTAYEKEIVQLVYGINELDRASQTINKTVAQNVGSAKAQIAVDQSLLSIINNVNKSTKERETALTQLKSQYEGNIELQKTDINDGEKLTKVLDKISAALIRKAKAQAFAELIAKQEAKLLELQSQSGEEVVKNLGFMKTVYSLLKGGMDGFNASSMVALDAFGEQGKQIKNTVNFLKILNQALNSNTEEQIKNNDAATLSDTKPGKPKADKSQKLIDKELERQKKATLYLQQWESKFLADSQKALDDADEKKRKEEVDSYKQRITDFKTFYSNKLQLAEGDRQEQKSILEQQMQDLIYFYQTFGMYAGDVGDIFSDVYKKWVDNNKAITDEATKNIINLGIGIMNALGPALDMLLEKGASIGEVLSTAFTDIIKKLVKVAIAAAVAVAIISLLPGMQGKIAEAGGKLAYFGKLVGTGMGIPNLFNSSAGSTATNTAQGVSNGLNASNGINVNVVGKIAGGDILLASQQAQRNNESTF